MPPGAASSSLVSEAGSPSHLGFGAADPATTMRHLPADARVGHSSRPLLRALQVMSLGKRLCSRCQRSGFIASLIGHLPKTSRQRRAPRDPTTDIVGCRPQGLRDSDRAGSELEGGRRRTTGRTGLPSRGAGRAGGGRIRCGPRAPSSCDASRDCWQDSASEPCCWPLRWRWDPCSSRRPPATRFRHRSTRRTATQVVSSRSARASSTSSTRAFASSGRTTSKFRRTRCDALQARSRISAP